jgi:F-type H+-transporting ATPase subunit b
MLDAAIDHAERNVLKANEEFHVQIENRKKNTEDRIKQIKNQALKDIKNASVKISIQAVEVLLKNSLDKNKLNKIFTTSVEETKLALKRKST